jgi:hypothetical protein
MMTSTLIARAVKECRKLRGGSADCTTAGETQAAYLVGGYVMQVAFFTTMVAARTLKTA